MFWAYSAGLIDSEQQRFGPGNQAISAARKLLGMELRGHPNHDSRPHGRSL
jgi:hypothetical protein